MRACFIRLRMLTSVLLTKYNSGDQIENNEMGGACSTYAAGREDVRTGFWWGNERERGHLEGLGVDGKVILRWIFSNLDGEGMNWIDLAQDKDRLRAF